MILILAGLIGVHVSPFKMVLGCKKGQEAAEMKLLSQEELIVATLWSRFHPKTAFQVQIHAWDLEKSELKCM